MKKFNKRILSFLLIVAMMFSAMVVFSAEDEEPPEYEPLKMPEAWDNLIITNTKNAPVMDGIFDENEDWGDPIYDLTGQDAYDQTIAGITPDDPRLPTYRSWATTTDGLWKLENGSVEKICQTRVRLYAKWDIENIYLCFVNEGWTPYYYNFGEDGYPEWKGNGIQVAFGCDVKNQDPKAKDPDGNGSYLPGEVGNEYLFTLNDPKYMGAKDPSVLACVTRGLYRGKVGQSMGTLKAGGKDYTDVETGKQVIEITLKWKDIGCDQNLRVNKEIFFAAAYNFNIDKGMAAGDFNGFQVGQGIFQQDKTAIWNSFKLKLDADLDSGDVDGNLTVDDQDAMTLARYLANWDGISIIEYSADVDADGEITDRDAMTLSRYLANWPGIVLKAREQ